MERRHFLKLAIGFAGGAAALAASARAAPLPPVSTPQYPVPPRSEDARPAVTTQDDVISLKPEQVRWGHHGHRHGHRHHWGRHRRHWGWHRRHWGWRRHHWHRHRW